MPGLITHAKLFRESVLSLSRRKEISPYTRSLEILFHNKYFLQYGYFGVIGPNLFDYLPFQRRGFLGPELTEFLHSRGLKATLQNMAKKTLIASDYNNEWNATRRAFLYGYVSHIIADSMFHPFVFYWSGFPDTSMKKEVYSQRQQFLLFQYNMDLFFEYFHGGEPYPFSIKDLLPLKRTHGRLITLDNSVKSLLLEMLRETYPAINALPFLKNACIPVKNGFTSLDALPYIILYSHGLKRKRSTMLAKILKMAQRYKLCYPDYITEYPDPRRINRHVLNLHRERWYYPAGKSGLNYESVEDLFRLTRDRIVDAWDKMEAILFTGKKNITPLLDELGIDAYTGEPGKYSHKMKIKNPVRLGI